MGYEKADFYKFDDYYACSYWIYNEFYSFIEPDFYILFGLGGYTDMELIHIDFDPDLFSKF